MTTSRKPIPPPPLTLGTYQVEMNEASPDCLRSDSLATVSAEALANRAATASMTSTERHISGTTRFCMSAPRSWK